MKEEGYSVAIFESVYHVLRCEKIMKEQKIEYKIIPVPRHISSDCGVCLRFPTQYQEEVLAAIDDKVEVESIHPL